MKPSSYPWLILKQARTLSMIALVALLVSQASSAQILQGKWVDASEAAIEKNRKTDVIVIVLDRADRAVQHATVRLTQRRHDFVVGLTVPSDRMPPENCRTLPVYRAFNAIALDRYTDWSQTSEISPQLQAKRLTAWQEAIEPRRIHFGRVISADPARNHDRLSLLRPADLRDALLARIDLATVYDPAPHDYDLYSDVLKQDMVERKLGLGMMSRMFDRAEAGRPEAGFGLRVREAIALRSGRDFVSTIQKLEVRQVPFNHITIEQTFRGPIQPNALKRMLDDFVAPMPVPVTLAGLEVGGPTPVAAAINLETVLRLAFAQPRIAGIYVGGLLDSELLEENATLLDDVGQPTASGTVLEQLFTKHWHSDLSGKTDERGNMQARVFTGWYAVTATMPDGTTIQSEAYIPYDDRAKIIVLQATVAEAK